MTLEEIYDEWNTDATIDDTQLDLVSLNTSKLVAKYSRIRSSVKREIARLENTKNGFYEFLFNYYVFPNKVEDDDLSKYGYENNDKVPVPKVDADRAINADRKWQKIVLEMAELKNKLETVDAILKDLHSRTFYVKNAIEDRKYKQAMI